MNSCKLMARKSSLMEKFEKENPGKHAVWNGIITDQYIKWKKENVDPNHPNYKELLLLYETKDGFQIEERLGDIDYYAKVLEEVVERYGLSETIDKTELKQIGQEINNYISTDLFRGKMGWPIMCNIDYRSDLEKIAQGISTMDEKSLNSEDSYLEFCKQIMKQIKKANSDDYGRTLSH